MEIKSLDTNEIFEIRQQSIKKKCEEINEKIKKAISEFKTEISISSDYRMCGILFTELEKKGYIITNPGCYYKIEFPVIVYKDKIEYVKEIINSNYLNEIIYFTNFDFSDIDTFGDLYNKKNIQLKYIGYIIANAINVCDMIKHAYIKNDISFLRMLIKYPIKEEEKFTFNKFIDNKPILDVRSMDDNFMNDNYFFWKNRSEENIECFKLLCNHVGFDKETSMNMNLNLKEKENENLI
jgi:hypothetical protein